MVRCLILFLMGSIATAFSTSPARSDTRNPFREPPSWLHLIQEPGFQKRLKLSDEQTAEIQQIVDTSAAEPDAARKEIEELLSVQQRRALRKLDLQQEGGYALLHERIAAYLLITAEQQTKLDEALAANETLHTEMRNTMMVARFASAEAMAKFVADYREKADRALLEILTDDQAKKFKALFADAE